MRRRSSKARLVVALIAFAVTGCLPYPIHSPRVEQGLAVGGVVGLRAFVRDTANGVRGQPQPSLVPEAGLTASAGLARADGAGPALRVSGAFGFPNIMAADVYAQLPRLGRLIAGGGTLVTIPHAQEDRRRWAKSPYAMLGWQRKNETMLYGSMVWYSTHLQNQADTTVSTVTAQAIIIGLQGRRLTPDGKGSLSQRVFIAGFHSKRTAESVWGFPVGGQVPLRSVVLVGGSFDVAWGWSSLHRPTRRPTPWPPPRRAGDNQSLRNRGRAGDVDQPTADRPPAMEE